MAKSAGIIPSWVETLDAAIENKAEVFVGCTKCKAWQRVDLKRIRMVKPGDYSLVNRRCRCRITQGCEGWNRFHYLHGVVRPLWDNDTAMRWIFSE